MTSESKVSVLIEAGLAAHRQGDLAAAEQAYVAILEEEPDHAGVLQLLGVLRQAQGDRPEAERLIRAALALREDPVFYGNLAFLLHDWGRSEEAEAAYRRALDLDPAFLDAQRNYGAFLKTQDRPDDALARFNVIAALTPDDAGVHAERGVVLETLGRPAEAESAYRRSLEIDPGHAGARLNLAFLALRRGDFDQGWRLYEGRHDQTGAALAPPLAPGCRAWRGEPLTGRSLLVYGEQGFGDQIQFIRYAQMAKRAGAARVSVAVAPELVRLFRQVPGLDAVIALDGAEPHPADYWTWMLNLPQIFRTQAAELDQTLPPDFPQFHLPNRPRSDRPRAAGALLEVGVFWAGRDWTPGPNMKQVDALRSLDFETILPLLTAPELAAKVRWTLLQRDRRPPGLAALSLARGWRDPLDPERPDGPVDFLDTAHIVADLDLVIGVDSALIHLSAALGRPTWMMDRLAHCWRWVGDGESSGWYPDLRIFRQTAPRDWTPVIAGLIKALAALDLGSKAPLS